MVPELDCNSRGYGSRMELLILEVNYGSGIGTVIHKAMVPELDCNSRGYGSRTRMELLIL